MLAKIFPGNQRLSCLGGTSLCRLYTVQVWKYTPQVSKFLGKYIIWSKEPSSIKYSANLGSYPSRAALINKKCPVGKQKHALLTSELIEEFVQVIREVHVFSTRMSASDKKAALGHAWTNRLCSFLNNATWNAIQDPIIIIITSEYFAAEDHNKIPLKTRKEQNYESYRLTYNVRRI